MKAREAQIIGDASKKFCTDFIYTSCFVNLKIIELCFNEADRN